MFYYTILYHDIFNHMWKMNVTSSIISYLNRVVVHIFTIDVFLCESFERQKLTENDEIKGSNSTPGRTTKVPKTKRTTQPYVRTTKPPRTTQPYVRTTKPPRTTQPYVRTTKPPKTKPTTTPCKQGTTPPETTTPETTPPVTTTPPETTTPETTPPVTTTPPETTTPEITTRKFCS